jgi:hypothetical protein
VPRLTNAQGILTNGLGLPARKIQDGFDCIHVYMRSLSTHLPQRIYKLSTSALLHTNINVHENEAEVPRRDSSTGVLTKDPTIYTRITVYSANITSAVVILHSGARARMGRMRTNTSKLAPGNLQHWWTFSNAVAGGPQSSYGVIMTSIRSARPHLTSSRVIDLTCTLIIACRW